MEKKEEHITDSEILELIERANKQYETYYELTSTISPLIEEPYQYPEYSFQTPLDIVINIKKSYAILE